MKALLARPQALWNERSVRERWILIAAACVIGLWIVDAGIVSPLERRIAEAQRRIEDAEVASLRAGRVAQQLHALRAELAGVEAQIQPGADTNLLALIESLARESGVGGALEAIKPRQGSSNALYPETRVEVSLKGVPIKQTIQFLHAIEEAPLHLLVRSLRIRKVSGTVLLNVSFFVSSFERA